MIGQAHLLRHPAATQLYHKVRIDLFAAFAASVKTLLCRPSRRLLA
jgi:hypothetical protein